MNYAIIPAAGAGRRMGGDRAKQFLELAGEPVAIHTLRRFDECPAVDAVIVAVPADDVAMFLDLAGRAGLRKIERVIPGGAERQESVARALASIRPESAGIVVVHDAVRPFVTSEQIAEVIAAAAIHGAAILAQPASDTVKEVWDGKVVRTLDRSRIALAQTPQAFAYGILRDAHARAANEGWTVTDDASLVEQAGGTVAVVAGSSRNIKITHPDDMALAELLFEEEFGRSASGKGRSRRLRDRR